MNGFKKIQQILLTYTITLLCACGGGSNDSPNEPESDAIVVSSIVLDKGMLQPNFASSVLEYNATLSYTTSSIRVKPTFVGGSVTVNGSPVLPEGASNDITLAEGNNLIEVAASSADGSKTIIYTLNLLRQPLGEFAQAAFIKASDTGEFDTFGNALAIDGNTMVVGAETRGAITGWSDNVGATGNGAVYVFVLEDGVWRQQALLATNADGSDYFGGAVAIEGDTIIIGARFEDSNSAGVNGDESDNSLSNSGAAYVYQREGGSWTKQAFLKSSNPTENSSFGSSVAISNNTIAVGAHNEDSGSSGINGNQTNNDKPNSGAVYLFTLNNNIWRQEAYLKASNPDEGDSFGFSLALDGDTLAVGADNEDSSSTGINGDDSNNLALTSGAVYVFERSIGVWQQQAYIKPSNTMSDQFFGMSLALQGDTLAVTAPWEDGGSKGINGDQGNLSENNSGAVYVFTRSGNEWSQQAYIKASNSFSENGFGFGRNSLALDGSRLLVGASGENSRTSGVNGDESDNAIFLSTGNGLYDSIGAAYLFEFVQGEWSQLAYLKPSNPSDRIGFGGSVALTQDYLIVGAENEKTRGTGINPSQSTFDSFGSQSFGNQGAGAIYVYSAN